MGVKNEGGRFNDSFREINFHHHLLYFCQFPVDKMHAQKAGVLISVDDNIILNQVNHINLL